MNLFTRYRRWLIGPSAWYAKGLAWLGVAFVLLVIVSAIVGGGEEDRNGGQPRRAEPRATSSSAGLPRTQPLSIAS